jgi:hypothetical protein
MARPKRFELLTPRFVVWDLAFPFVSVFFLNRPLYDVSLSPCFPYVLAVSIRGAYYVLTRSCYQGPALAHGSRTGVWGQ